MSFPTIVNQMFFRFCRPMLDIFGFPLLIDRALQFFIGPGFPETQFDPRTATDHFMFVWIRVRFIKVGPELKTAPKSGIQH